MSSTVDRTRRRFRLRCVSISKAARNDVATAIPSHKPCGVRDAGDACVATYNSPKAAISTTAIIRPSTTAGTSSARVSSQKNSGTAASLTQMLVSNNARAQSACPRSSSRSLPTKDKAERTTTARYVSFADCVRALCRPAPRSRMRPVPTGQDAAMDRQQPDPQRPLRRPESSAGRGSGSLHEKAPPESRPTRPRRKPQPATQEREAME